MEKDVIFDELHPLFVSRKNEFCLIEDKKKALVNEAQEKAKKVLVDSGFREQEITLKVEARKKGTARDILDEARSDYDTVVMGRRGLSEIKEFFLGSVSHKVLNGSKNLSVVLVS